MFEIDWSQTFFILKFIGVFLGIIASLYACVKFIDSRILKKLDDPNFVKDIAQQLRPYLIFNEKGEIIVERGAMNFIKSIDISMEDELPKSIILTLKKHKATAPILLSLDNDMCTIKERRGTRYDWVYDIEYHGWNQKDERRFNVEIVT